MLASLTRTSEDSGNRRRPRLHTWLIALSLALAVEPVSAAIAPKHDLGPPRTAGQPMLGDDAAACVFCHTPSTQDAGMAAVPRWNQSAVVGATYTPYGSKSATLEGEILPVGAVSLPCLSCHDGAQAADNVINAPEGAGTGSAMAVPDEISYEFGQMPGSPPPLVMLPGDLSNHHPIGVHYCGGGPTYDTPARPCTNPDFKGGAGNPGLQIARVNEGLRFWVDSGPIDGMRQKTDLPLYTRHFADGEAPSVECASCHDPHGTPNPTFLRISNAGSRVCLTCHVK